ncbi:hypothetical protein [Pseudoalteromonas luteoviolacea]|uniref:Uncharacterized protein n=1 Tax=Pseudoalteromonas luteoviolacea S4054 TaxID=1129367 RepID=A0A0F6ABG2_9GAMM|nr:hypothetical protein [Pseudoalteromonas luteoviolacea]AOT08526.1 hypothetical protein S4054249_12000 [Pseudoalteromonas luteoviolacea]AOT13442.1 hypothetical protein S40542_11975 [Pseudoalteromonas luteoviolacea]AOT18355.1 hypothetical protein S4054_11975 [Pseudoalteromonas luteoviolacea]KKE83478.1 hypothetical protein N479_13990 [Pseudoalteromonas luteoviolacea S4054]KZN75915.1 hypothetical protein N481_06085 [Pseudoalteromonas luteoviolacea S4047-1]
MAFKYLNVNALLKRIDQHQQYIERYIGFISMVDSVFEEPISLSQPMPPSYWQSLVLLTSQQQQIENGLYQISSIGMWQRLSIELELGNIVALKETQNSSNRYFKLVEHGPHKQAWQAFSLDGYGAIDKFPE